MMPIRVCRWHATTGLAFFPCTLSLQLRAVEITDIERRVAKLERALVTNKVIG